MKNIVKEMTSFLIGLQNSHRSPRSHRSHHSPRSSPLRQHTPSGGALGLIFRRVEDKWGAGVSRRKSRRHISTFVEFRILTDFIMWRCNLNLKQPKMTFQAASNRPYRLLLSRTHLSMHLEILITVLGRTERSSK